MAVPAPAPLPKPHSAQFVVTLYPFYDPRAGVAIRARQVGTDVDRSVGLLGVGA